MKIMRGRIFLLMGVVLLVAAFPMCSRNAKSSTSSNANILRGQEIIIGNWWGNYDVNTYQPRSEIEELVLEWRKKVLEEYGVVIREELIAGWGEMQQATNTSIMAGNPVAHVFILQPDWAMSLYRQGLLYPVSDNTVVNLKNSQTIVGKQTPYNQMMGDLFTFNGKQYAFAIGAAQSSPGVYFNKRLLMKAGVDPELPYNMQRDGTWTWDNFLELCKRLTRDQNNTGQIDTWAMPSDFTPEILGQLVFSNGGNWVLKDDSGRFVNGTNRPEFIEALQFARRMLTEGVMMPKAEGAAWDWFWPAFVDGHVAMIMERGYRRGSLGGIVDDWGYVLPPRGPRVREWNLAASENVMVIPATFSAEQVDAILMAVNLWNMPVEDDWKTSMYSVFRDRRAVDETMVLMRDPRYHSFMNATLIPNLNLGDIAWVMWAFEGEPAQLVESVSPSWNATIAAANR